VRTLDGEHDDPRQHRIRNCHNVIGLHAIDLSSLVEVGVCEVSPTRFSGEVHGAIIGLVCEHGAGTGHFCVQPRSSGYVRGFVWLSDPAKGITGLRPKFPAIREIQKIFGKWPFAKRIRAEYADGSGSFSQFPV
jgi:hypothetical protein